MIHYGINGKLSSLVRYSVIPKTMIASDTAPPLQKIFEKNKVDVTIDTCDHGHNFAKLPDHPVKDGKARCPYCLSVGFDAFSNQLKHSVSFTQVNRALILANIPYEQMLKVMAYLPPNPLTTISSNFRSKQENEKIKMDGATTVRKSNHLYR